MKFCPYKIEEKTLVLGCGGGFDIYSCLPWYLQLDQKTKDLCILANYSFTDDLYKYGDQWIVEVDGQTPFTLKNQDYFPEKHLSSSLQVPILTVRLISNPLLNIELEKFVISREIKQIILVDGGVDACLYGDEKPYGSPTEDSQSVIACYLIALRLNLPCKLMCCALYVDEVNVDTFLKHWDQLKIEKHKIQINKDDFPYEKYKEIVQGSIYRSIIHESIIAALEGHRDRYNNLHLSLRIDDPRDMPLLKDDTTYLWWLDLNEYVSFSPFYSKLLDLISSVPQESSVNDTWVFWDQKIVEILDE